MICWETWNYGKVDFDDRGRDSGGRMRAGAKG